MAGTINSLGIGSGVLTSDVIDKLKANDESLVIKPIDNKIAIQQQKSQALDLLKSLLISFKSNISSLSDDTLYQKRSVSGNNSGVSVTALSGSAIQSFSVANTQLAKKDVVQSGNFTSTTDKIATGDGILTLNIGKTGTSPGTDYSIPYTAGTTLEDLKLAINEKAGTNVTASLLQTGSSAYSLVITSKETGSAQKITLTNNGNLNPQLDTDIQTIQNAQDSSFDYNGIKITRSTNTIDDLIIGVSINLLQDNASSTISISQNTQAIADELNGLATSYNTLTKQLDDMTLSDLENNKIGIFNGDNTIKSIKREITKMLTSVNIDGNSLAQYGIGLSENGTMNFVQSDFDTQMASDSTKLENFFSGYTDEKGNYTEGLFGNMDALLNSYTGSTGLMSTLVNASTHESKSLTTERERSMNLISARYQAMSNRFAEYDAIISKINSQFASLNQQIQAMLNAK